MLNMHTRREREREGVTSSANQLGCTDVSGLSVTWSEHQYQVFIMSKQSEMNVTLFAAQLHALPDLPLPSLNK